MLPCISDVIDQLTFEWIFIVHWFFDTFTHFKHISCILECHITQCEISFFHRSFNIASISLLSKTRRFYLDIEWHKNLLVRLTHKRMKRTYKASIIIICQLMNSFFHFCSCFICKRNTRNIACTVPRSLTRYAKRCVKARVLPLPAPAITRI